MEALGDALDQLLEKGLKQNPPELSLDMARLLRGQEQLLRKVEGLSRPSDASSSSAALAKGPGQPTLASVGAVLGQGVVALRDSVQHLERAVQSVEREREQLGQLVGSALLKADQRRTMMWSSLTALLCGLVLAPLLLLAMPLAVSSHVAAFVLGADRWEAGAVLMHAGDPEQWPDVVDAVRLVRGNKPALASCKEAALKSRREQHCTVTVAAPP